MVSRGIYGEYRTRHSLLPSAVTVHSHCNYASHACRDNNAHQFYAIGVNRMTSPSVPHLFERSYRVTYKHVGACNWKESSYRGIHTVLLRSKLLSLKMETHATTPSVHYQEPRIINTNEEADHYEDIGNINLGAMQMKSRGNARKTTNAIYEDVDTNSQHSDTVNDLSKHTCPHTGHGCIGAIKRVNGSLWMSIVMVILIIISSTSLLINILVIKGRIIVTPNCCNRG